MEGYGVSGGVPVLHPMLQSGQHHLVQEVLHLPGREERHPRLQEVDDGGKLQEGEGDEDVAKLWHPCLPHQTIVGVHTEVERRVNCSSTINRGFVHTH